MFYEVFLEVKLQKYFSRFFKEKERFTDSAVATKQRHFLKLQQDIMDTAYFSIAPTKTLNTVCMKNCLRR